MSTSTDPDHFFQTSHSLAETRRRAQKSSNNHGHPVRLQSKILAVIRDPNHQGAVYVAESTGTARRIVLETDEVSPPFVGASGPLTSLGLSPNHPSTVLFAGSWDCLIHSWSISTRSRLRTYAGHSDFVKAITTLRLLSCGSEVLISGGADTRIIVWDIATGAKLHVIKAHSRGVLELAVLPTHVSFGTNNEATLFSADSLGEIRRFDLTKQNVTEVESEKPIRVHETSVFKLVFDEDGDLWTASADGDVICLGREKGWSEEMRVKTGSWVRGVAIEEIEGWIVSGGRDEDIRVWERGSGRLYHHFSGHYDEIMDMVLVEQMLITVSLDGTVRRWSLKARDLAAARRETEEEARNEGLMKEPVKVADGARGETVMTEEEERELAELMEDD